MWDKLRSLLHRVEFILHEQARLMQRGPHLNVFLRIPANGKYHRHAEGEPWAIVMVFRGKEECLPLADSLLYFLNYLCHTRHIPQTANQIAIGMRKTRTSRQLMTDTRGAVRKFGRGSVKIYVARTRDAIDVGLKKLAVPLSSTKILVSEKSASNQTLYRLRVTVEWIICEPSTTIL